MKKVKNRLVVAVLAFVFFITGVFAFGGIKRENADAYTFWDKENYDLNYQWDVIYYFSDSAPLFEPTLGDGYEGFGVVYDVQHGISESELYFMLYTGYFWGFNQDNNNLVIIELKNMQPAGELISRLFECLKAQGCKTMFLSPYADQYGGDDIDATLEIAPDNFFLLIDSSFQDMEYVGIDFSHNAALLLDGRWLGIDGQMDDYNMGEIYAQSPALRRILMRLYFASGYGGIAEFDLYRNLSWWYESEYQQDIGFDSNYLNHSYPDIGGFISIWEEMDSSDEMAILWRSREKIEEYLAVYSEYAIEYFGSILEILRRQNSVSIFVHVQDNLYLELTEYGFYYAQFNNLMDFEYNFGFEHVYAMGTWYLKPEFYDFLFGLQNAYDNYTPGKEDGKFVLPLFEHLKSYNIFVWEEFPIEFGENGLRVTTLHSGLDYLLGEWATVDYETLKERFLDGLNEVISLF